MTEAAWQQRTMLTTTIFEAEVDLETSLMFRSACIAAAWTATCKLQESDKCAITDQIPVVCTDSMRILSSMCGANMCHVFFAILTNLQAAAIHFRLQLDEAGVAACLQVSCPETPFTPFSLDEALGVFPVIKT